MGSASREARAAAIESLRGGGTKAGAELATGLFAFADALGAVPQLRSMVSDPAADPSTRAEVVSAVFSSVLPAPTLEFVSRLVRSEWSKPSELLSGVVDLGVIAVATGVASQSGTAIGDLIDELFGAARVFGDNRDLQLAIPSPAGRDGVTALIDALFGSKVSAPALVLIAHAATHSRGGMIAPTLVRYAQIVAEFDGRKLATVTTARPLTAERRAAVVSGLEAQFGSKLYAGFVVDGRVIGGLRAEVGSEILDATTKTRLGELRTALVH